MFNSVAVANKFIQLAGYENRLLTQMQLHKLVFFAHALALASQDTPLIRGAFIATQYGPVEAELWEFTKSYGPDLINNYIHTASSDMRLEILVLKDATAMQFCKTTWKNYGKYSSVELSRITHKPGSPWQQTYRGEWTVIPNALILEYYQTLLSEAS